MVLVKHEWMITFQTTVISQVFVPDIGVIVDGSCNGTDGEQWISFSWGMNTARMNFDLADKDSWTFTDLVASLDMDDTDNFVNATDAGRYYTTLHTNKCFYKTIVAACPLTPLNLQPSILPLKLFISLCFTTLNILLGSSNFIIKNNSEHFIFQARLWRWLWITTSAQEKWVSTTASSAGHRSPLPTWQPCLINRGILPQLRPPSRISRYKLSTGFPMKRTL